MKIDEVMHFPVITVTAEQSIISAAKIMADSGVGFLPVLENGYLVGVVTDRDIVVRGVSVNQIGDSVKKVMTPEPITVVSGTEVISVAKTMATNRIRRTLVMRDGHIMGVVSTKDVLKSANTLPYVLETYRVSNTSPYYRIYDNGNPHDSVDVGDYPL